MVLETENSGEGPKIKHKKTLPIAWRLSLHVAGIGILLCLTILFSILPFQYSRVEKEAITEARILAEAVSTIYQSLKDEQPHEQARRLLLRVARIPHISLVNILDKDGFIKYSTDSRELGKKTPINFGVIKEENQIIVSHVVSENNSSIGSVNVIIDRELMIADIHKLFAQAGVALFVMIFILAILAKGLVESLVSFRLSRLLQLTDNAEQGYFLGRAMIDRYDEIGQLTSGLNYLLGIITKAEAVHLERDHGLQDAMAQKNIRLKLEETFDQLKISSEKLERKVQAQDLLMQAAHRLGGTLKKEAIVERLLGLIEEKLHWPQFAIFLCGLKENEKTILKLAGSMGMSKELLPNTVIEMGDGIAGMVAQTGAPVIISDIEADSSVKAWDSQKKSLFFNHFKRSGSLMVIPMNSKGSVVGVMVFLNQKVGSFDSDDADLMCALGAQAALAITNAGLYETTLELATVDPLTTVLNRRAMVRNIEYELARAQRFKTKAALLLADVDHFKAYNDRMGHVLGDVALKEVALALKNNIRKVDSIARFGGEEFCVILPQADIDSAQEVAKKLCDSVRALEIRGADKQPLGYLSISIGIALIPDDIEDIFSETATTDIISAADQALYEAKRLGRDRFIKYSLAAKTT